jgi:MFS transporter, DHA1 family, multidrug resistance protein
VAGGLLLAGGLLVLFFTREAFVPPVPGSRATQGRIREVLRKPGMAAMLSVYLMIAVAGSMVGPIFPLFVESLAGKHANVATLTGAIIAVTGIAAALMATTLGRLGDRVGRKRLLVLCTLGSGLLLLPQAAVRTVAQFFVLRTLMGVTSGGTGPTINSLISSLVPQHSYGRAYGLTQSVSSLGWMCGPLIGGLLAAHLGYRWAFLMTGVTLLVVAVMTLATVRDDRELPDPALNGNAVVDEEDGGESPAP